jgi:hypothetical protein
MTRKAKDVAPRWRYALTRKVLVLVRDVEVAGVVEVLELLGSVRGDLVQDREQVVLVERVGVLHLSERAVASEDRRLADLQVDVGRAQLDGPAQEAVQVHLERGIGSSGPRL